MVINLSIIIASLVLLTGVILGLIDFKMNLKALHTALGIAFIVIVLLGLRTHFLRLSVIPKDPVSWGHMFIFSWILFLSVSAIRRWNTNRKRKIQESLNNNGKFIVYYKGNAYNIQNFVPEHPGGSVINKAKNKNLEKVWKENGVSWHNDNQRVKNILLQNKIKN